MNWSTSSRLIELVKDLPMLWESNLNDKLYLDLRQKLWRTISDQLNSEGFRIDGKKWEPHIAKLKFKNLRDSYMRMMNKNVRTPWVYYEALSFLKPFYRGRRSKNMRTSDSVIPLEYQIKEESVSIKNEESPEFEREKYLNCCRICLKKAANMKSLVSVYHDSLPYVNMVYECTGTILEDYKECPLKICFLCEDELLTSYKFKKKFIESEKILLEYTMNFQPTDKIKIELHDTDDDETKASKKTFNEIDAQDDSVMIYDLHKNDVFTENQSSNVFKLSGEEEEEEKEEEEEEEDDDYDGVDHDDDNDDHDNDDHDNDDNGVQKIYEYPSESFECNICKLSYKSRDSLRNHELHYHATPPQKINNSNISINNENTCKICNKVFKTKRICQDHEKAKHGNAEAKKRVCPHCGKLVRHSYYTRHVGNHVNRDSNHRPFVCKECGKSYFNVDYYRMHLRAHTDVKPYQCDLCDEKFKFWSSRRVHIRRNHLKIKPYVCSYCNEAFLYCHTYYKHIRRDHTGELPHKCEICERKFLTTTTLKRHRLTHSEARNFSCDICKKSYKDKKALYIHLQIHSGERNYICPVCNKAFIQNHVMKSHVYKVHPEQTDKLPPSGTIVSQRALKRLGITSTSDTKQSDDVEKIYVDEEYLEEYAEEYLIE